MKHSILFFAVIFFPFLIRAQIPSENSRSEDSVKDQAVSRTKEVEPDLRDFIEISEEPKPLNNFQELIVYPDDAMKSNLGGKVTVSMLIGKDGTVRKAIIERADYDIFRKPVLDAIKKLRFSPAKQDGKPVMVWYTQSVNFRIPPQNDSNREKN